MAEEQSNDSQNLDLLKKLDLVGEAFESAWNSDGEKPTIEAFIEKYHDVPADRLTKELVELEIEFRLKTGDVPTADEYMSRFPEMDRHWLSELIESKSAHTHTLPPNSDSDETIPPKRTPEPIGDSEQPTLAPGSQPSSAKSPTKFKSFGDYEIIDEIARGGMGVVYKARQKSLNRIVALKMILSGQLAGVEEIQRFRSEAESAANLDHPGIVPIYEIGEQDGHQYFSMGFVEGESLQAKIIDGPLPAKEAAELTVKIAEAIRFAHEKGVIHRDLKPANVLIDPNGEPRVTDFGLAKQLGGDSDLTGTGQILGTPSFMPPEQAAGQTSDVDERTDVWALGAILYTLITGRPPFQAATPIDTLMQVIEKEPVRPRTLDSKIPVDLETIALKCLEKEPGKRYQESQSLILELQRFANDEPILARPIGRTTRAWRWCKRKPLAALSICLVFAVIASLIAIYTQYVASKARHDALAARQKVLGELDIDDPSKLHVRKMPGLHGIYGNGRLHTHSWRIHKPKGKVYAVNIAVGDVGFSLPPSNQKSVYVHRNLVIGEKDSRLIRMKNFQPEKHKKIEEIDGRLLIVDQTKVAAQEFVYDCVFSMSEPGNVNDPLYRPTKPRWTLINDVLPKKNANLSSYDFLENFQDCFQSKGQRNRGFWPLNRDETVVMADKESLELARFTLYDLEHRDKAWQDYLLRLGHEQSLVEDAFRDGQRRGLYAFTIFCSLEYSKQLPNKDQLNDLYQAGLVKNLRGYVIYVEDITSESKD